MRATKNARKLLTATFLVGLFLLGTTPIATALPPEGEEGTGPCHGHAGEQSEIDTDGNGDADTVRCYDGTCTHDGVHYYECDVAGNPTDDGPWYYDFIRWVCMPYKNFLCGG